MGITAKPIPPEVREEVMQMFNGFCCMCYERAIEVHHRNSNSKMNNDMFPLLMQSPFMLVPICRTHHEDGKVLKALKYTEKQMMIYEKYLQGVQNGI